MWPHLGEKQVHVSVVIGVARAHTLPPSGVSEAGLLGHVLKVKPAEIVVKMRRKGHWTLFQPVPLDNENIRQAVVIVVEDGHARAGIFHQGGLIQIAGDDHGTEPGLGRHVPEIDSRGFHPGRKGPHGLILSFR